MQSFCPAFQTKGCPCENPVVLGLIFVGFNALLVFIDVYEVSLISLVSFSALLLVVFAMIHAKVQEFSQNKKNLEDKSEDNLSEQEKKEKEEKFQAFFRTLYEKINDFLQFLRKIVLFKDKSLTLKAVIFLYIDSQIAYSLGDFMFIAVFGNVLIVAPLVYSRFGEKIHQNFKKGQDFCKEKSKLLLDKLPKYSDLKKTA